MTENRSVPTNTVLPHIYYQNVVDAIDWLSKTFGFAEHYRYGDTDAISGAFTTGRQISPEPGLLPYVWVESIDATLNRAAAEGGVVVKAPHPDSPGSACWSATFRDPAGNLMGLYQEGPR